MRIKAKSDEKKRIGELLVDAGLISQKQLAEALARQKKCGEKIVESLTALGYIDPHTFVKFRAKQPGVASIDLLHCTVTEE